MLRLKNIYQGIKKYSGKIAISVAIAGAVAGIRSCAKNMGEEVYRGNINDKEVVYEEGRISLKEDAMLRENRMRVKKGDITYIFEDCEKEIGIDWKKELEPDFKNDELERVVINYGDDKREYFSSKINDLNLDGKHAKEIFDKANSMYSELRTKIREQLREDYQKQMKSIEETLK